MTEFWAAFFQSAPIIVIPCLTVAVCCYFLWRISKKFSEVERDVHDNSRRLYQLEELARNNEKQWEWIHKELTTNADDHKELYNRFDGVIKTLAELDTSVKFLIREIEKKD